MFLFIVWLPSLVVAYGVTFISSVCTSSFHRLQTSVAEFQIFLVYTFYSCLRKIKSICHLQDGIFNLSISNSHSEIRCLHLKNATATLLLYLLYHIYIILLGPFLWERAKLSHVLLPLIFWHFILSK